MASRETEFFENIGYVVSDFPIVPYSAKRSHPWRGQHFPLTNSRLLVHMVLRVLARTLFDAKAVLSSSGRNTGRHNGNNAAQRSRKGQIGTDLGAIWNTCSQSLILISSNTLFGLSDVWN
jgi:hypothetical protein